MGILRSVRRRDTSWLFWPTWIRRPPKESLISSQTVCRKSELALSQLPNLHHSAAVSQRNQLSVLRNSYRLDSRYVGSEGARLRRTGGHNADNSIGVGHDKAIARWRDCIHHFCTQVGQRGIVSTGVAA